MLKKIKGTKYKLSSVKMIVRNCKRWMAGLGTTCLDYKKGFDMAPRSWLKKCKMMFGLQKICKTCQVVPGKMEYKANVWRTKVQNSEDKKRYISGRLFVTITFYVSIDTHVFGVERSKGRVSTKYLQGKVSHLLFMDE